MDDSSTIINLPEYVKHLGYNFTVQITPICSSSQNINLYGTSEVVDGTFTVYGKSGKFFWTVFAQRLDINVEPNKKDTKVKGDGVHCKLINLSLKSITAPVRMKLIQIGQHILYAHIHATLPINGCVPSRQEKYRRYLQFCVILFCYKGWV